MPNDFEMAAPIATAKIREQLSGNYRDAVQVAKHLHDVHFPHVPEWEPLPTLSGVLSQISNMITAWRPSTTTPGDAANAAATEICDYCGIDTNDAEEVAAIISKHCATDAGEVERLKKELSEAYYEDCEICERVIISANGDKVYTFIVCGRCWNETQQKLTMARANAVRECAKELRRRADHAASTGDHLPGTDRARELHVEARVLASAATVLMESLTKKEGDDGPTGG